MTPAEIKALLKLVAVLVLGAAIFFGVRKVLSWKEAAEANATTVQQQDREAEATGTITKAADAATTETQRVEVVVTQARQSYEVQYANAKQSDPAIGAWADGAVPQRVRDLARARRLARDGSGSDAAGGASAGPATGTAGGGDQAGRRGDH